MSESIDTLLARYVDDGMSAGMVALVSRRGRIEYRGHTGYADLASNTPIGQDSLFRIYSMTKPITSVALMMLVEAGHCALDDPAKRWIPRLADLEVYQRGAIASDITLRQLLTHTAGFSYGLAPDDEPVDRLYAELWQQPTHEFTLEQLVDRLLDLPLIAEPGERWRYSVATDLCGYLVERLSDMPLADYLRLRIFEPLGMADTAFTVPADKLDRFTTLYGYRPNDSMAQLEFADRSPYIPRDDSPCRLHSGGGGLVSTIDDYWRFAQMMLNRGSFDGHRILQADSVAQMTRNQIDTALLPLHFNGVARGPFRGYGFGLGYCVTIDPTDTAAAGSLGDFGWGGIADTYCWVDPARELVAILMQQYLPSLHHPGRRDFRNAVYRMLGDD